MPPASTTLQKQALSAFGELLVSLKFLSAETVHKLEAQASQAGVSLDEVVANSGLVTESDLLRARSMFYKIPTVDLTAVKIDEKTLRFLPKEIAENYRMVAFDQQGDMMSIAMIHPTNLKGREATEFLARNLGMKVRYFLTSISALKQSLKGYGNLSKEVESALDVAEKRMTAQNESKEEAMDESEEVIRSAPVSKIISVIMRHAIEGKASDIHIEPYGKESRVRYRIDGDLHTSLTLPVYLHPSLVSRVKVLANLKLDETRVPQDGRIRFSLPDRDVDFRVSIFPLSDSEKVVMRILETSQGAPTLDELGFMGAQRIILEKAIQKPHGMLLITGPTGSGKSTTLFSSMSTLNTDDINISTLEDPVEYRILGANQSQVHPEVGYTFATGLRAILRQDPDVIMVGEIRDSETAELAVHAALTGHVVMSTLHTNDAVGAIPRFLDLHVQSFLLASTLNAVLAQRLVRKICEHCKQQSQLTSQLLQEIEEEVSKIPKGVSYPGASLDSLQFFKGVGCNRCAGLGYKGRTTIVEAIDVTAELGQIIAEGAQFEKVQAELMRQNFISMRQEGILKALLGMTTIEEVWTTTSQD